MEEKKLTPEQLSELINSVCKAIQANEAAGNYVSVKNLCFDKLTDLLKLI